MIWTLSLGLEFCSPLCSYAGFASPLSNRNSFFTISLLFSYFFSHRLVKLDPLVGPDLSLKIHPLLALRAFCNSLKTLYFALRVEWKFETLKMWLLKSLCTSAALTCVNSNGVADFTSSVALWYLHSHSATLRHKGISQQLLSRRSHRVP